MATAEASVGPPAGASPEKSTAAAAAPSRSGGGGAADSYIGSLISLTSKSEIRYEGVLYTINTEESSIGLRNVRSFGTEGRKKDGPQIPASDKIYEYILFRGSDIKDLQVKSPVQPAQPVQPAPIHNDPAIIQSHYTRPSPPAATLPSSFPTGSTPDHFSTAGLQQRPPPFQTNIPPLYQPNSALPSWGPQPMGPQPNQPTPPPTNGSGLTLPPVYWQGYYPPPPPTGGFQLPQNHSIVRPPHGMPLQYPPPNLNQNFTPMNLPELPPLLQQQQPGTTTTTGAGTGTSNLNLSTITPASMPIGTETSRPVVTSSVSGFSAPSLAASLSLGSNIEPTASATSFSSSKLAAPVPPPTVETTVPLLTPGQLFQNSQTVPLSFVPVVPTTVSVPMQSSPKEIEIKLVEISNNRSENKMVEPVETKKDEPILPEPPIQVPAQVETKEPLLPSPAPAPYKSGAGHSYGHHNYNNNYRGRGRGRGPSTFSRQVTKFTEEFDFIAMNEKFNKDEVWGHLGKSKGHGEFDENDADETLDDDESETTKPVYVKDDFFDSLSCTSLDRDSRNGRPRFSEQMKLDTETFGNFPRHHRPMGMRGGGGGRWPRGGFTRGGRGGGSYYNNRGGYGYNNSNNSGRGSHGPSVYSNHSSS